MPENHTVAVGAARCKPYKIWLFRFPSRCVGLINLPRSRDRYDIVYNAFHHERKNTTDETSCVGNRIFLSGN